MSQVFLERFARPPLKMPTFCELFNEMVLDGQPGRFPDAGLPNGPYFDPGFSTNISVIAGGRAMLNCRVYNIGNRTVRLMIL